MIPEEAIEAAVEARRRIVPTGDGTYEQRATWAGLEAAAPFIRAQALEDAADELVRLNRLGATRADSCTPDEKADYRPMPNTTATMSHG
jgi:hypothetical protein